MAHIINAGTVRAKVGTFCGLTVAIDKDTGQPKDGAKPKFEIDFEILEGPDQGAHITGKFGFEGKGYDFTVGTDQRKGVLEVCGWDRQIDIDQITPGDLANEVLLVIDHEEYPLQSGDWRANVKFVNAIGGGASIEARRMNPTQAKSFASELRARMKSSGASTPRATNGATTSARPNGSTPVPSGGRRPAAPPTQPGADDDIPF